MNWVQLMLFAAGALLLGMNLGMMLVTKRVYSSNIISMIGALVCIVSVLV
jgi:hypothetical protein